MYQKVRVQQSNLQKAWTQVDKFLQRHGIRSDSFVSTWRRRRLVVCAEPIADPLQRDSRGTTPCDCMGQICPNR